MYIKSVNIQPMGLAFEPEFHITVSFTRQSNQFPLKFDGYLFLNRYRFAFLNEYELNNGNQDLFTAQNNNSYYDRNDSKTFVAPFSQIALNKLEEDRSKNPKGDVILNLKLNITCLEPKFDTVLTKIGEEDYNLISLKRDNSLFKIRSYDLNSDIRIPTGDWLHEFCPVFKNSKYQIFEIPTPKLNEKNEGLSHRVYEAIESLNEMEKARLEGDWNKVIKESRPVWELIRNKEDIKELIKGDHINEQTLISYNGLIDNLFNFSSKFIHRESDRKDGNKVMGINSANKEDAELIYAMAFSLTNLISKKLNK